jgi:hypothetical protein
MTRAESKMSDAERRLRIAMLDRKISRLDLAHALGIKVTFLGNVIRGGRCSPSLKRRITDFLKPEVAIWDDTPLECELQLGKNAEITFPTLKSAIEFVEGVDRAVGAGAVFRRSPKARTVGFLKDLTFIIDDDESHSPSPNEQSQQGAKNRELSARSIE